MEKRRLGGNGPQVSASGLGCMGTSDFHSGRDDKESVAAIHRALSVKRSKTQLAALNAVFPFNSAGERYPANMMGALNR
jgi:hypothetical protein